MKQLWILLRLLSRIPDIVVAALIGLTFALSSIYLLLIRGRSRTTMPPRPRMLYIGYTSLDQAQAKGLLRQESEIRRTYNPNSVLSKVTVFVPFGQRDHVTRLLDDLVFVEHATTQWPAFRLTQKTIRSIQLLLETRQHALEHDVVMIGGPHLSSFPGLFARLTTPSRFVLFIEAFWEDILPLQEYMSEVQRLFWRRWYLLLYKIFDAYIGGPSFKPDFYIARGMKKEKIWPYIHPIDVAALETASESLTLPKELAELPHPWIISVGRLEKEKLSSDCILTANILTDLGQDFSMIIIGEGSERNNLELRIKELKLQDRVILTSSLPNEMVYLVAKSSELCFAPYMGSALVEVMLAGCAVVAYENDPHLGIAKNSPIKFVHHGDYVEAANCLSILMSDINDLEVNRNKTKNYASKKWSMNNVSDAYLAPLIGYKAH